MAAADRPAAALTVADLLTTDELHGKTLLGGAAGLDRPVDGVDLVSTTSGPSEIHPRHLVLGALRGRRPFEMELLLRAAHDVGASAVLLLVDVHRPVVSTRRLADRLALPTLTLTARDPLALAWRLAQLVTDPRLHERELLLRGLGAIEQAGWEPGEIVRALDHALTGRSAVIASDGTVLAGADLAVDPGQLTNAPRQVVPQPVGQLVVCPMPAEDPHHPELWVALHITHHHPGWIAACAHVARAAGDKVASWATLERLTGERNARERTDVLVELLQAAEFGPAFVERALRAGLRLDGWHTALYLRSPGAARLAEHHARYVEQVLGHALSTGPLVERPDGWVTWLTTRSDPAKESYRKLTAEVRRVIETLRGAIDVVAGIGRPYEGPRGIERSIREARDAVLFAGYERRRGPVEHADELGVRRVLSEWYRTEGFRTYAEQILAPLLESHEASLLDTLGAYLDRESSTSSTATHLHVHRNTVAQRIARAEQLLGVNLSRPDDRLVIQLACRVLGFSSDGVPR